MIAKNGEKLSAKQWVIQSAINDLDLLTDFYYERNKDEWEAMSEVEQNKVAEQFTKLHGRVLTMLNRALNKE